MMWVRIDDQLHAHPKVQKAWHACDTSLGLHLLALSHAGCYRTDGYVDPEFVHRQLPQTKIRHRAVKALVDSGLWEANGNGWVIHDYLEYNPSRKSVEEVRRKRAEAGRRGGQARWQKQ